MKKASPSQASINNTIHEFGFLQNAKRENNPKLKE
tara:strand:- start:7 stop:111 length:105 start_codon:yes stop_codon:yes gene_type:complete